MGFYGTPDKKRHLTMARLELLFVNVKHGGIGRHVINNLFNIFESHWRTFVIQVFTFALTNDFDNRFNSPELRRRCKITGSRLSHEKTPAPKNTRPASV